MKILIISDVECKRYYDYYQPHMLDEFDLILSCGDLHSDYLQFLVTMSHAPLVYVHGNHDGHYEHKPPEGCICADDNLVKVNGLRILGLGGCMRYKPGPHMYTEKEMKHRAHALRSKIFFKHGFDILLTHAPAKGVNDGEDFPHMGFQTFNDLIAKYKPKYFIHGHVHFDYGKKIERVTKYLDTTVVNGYEAYILDYPDDLQS